MKIKIALLAVFPIFFGAIWSGAAWWGEVATSQEPNDAPPVASDALSELSLPLQGEGEAQNAEEPNPSIIRVAEDWDVWIDRERNLVIVDGSICFREGPLEMFACLPGTKEHESIVTLNTKAFLLHAALLAVGAEPGHPVRYDPEYAPAEGTEIEVIVLWTDEEGNRHQARAQDWIYDTQTEQAMEHPFVFGGSGFWVDEFSGERTYHAEGGEAICVSNFSTAMLDVPVASSAENAALLFCCLTEAIPPLDTPVRVLLIPQLEEEAEEEAPEEETAEEGSSAE